MCLFAHGVFPELSSKYYFLVRHAEFKVGSVQIFAAWKTHRGVPLYQQAYFPGLAHVADESLREIKSEQWEIGHELASRLVVEVNVSAPGFDIRLAGFLAAAVPFQNASDHFVQV